MTRESSSDRHLTFFNKQLKHSEHQLIGTAAVLYSLVEEQDSNDPGRVNNRKQENTGNGRDAEDATLLAENSSAQKLLLVEAKENIAKSRIMLEH